MALKVYAPASIGNVSVGYDILGAAISPVDGSLLGDCVVINGEADNGFSLETIGRFAHKLPADAKSNIVFQCCEFFQQEARARGIEVPSLSLTLEKNLPVGSGLGSSASSVVAALFALNEYADKPFNKHEMLAMMGKFEGKIAGSVHYDNVAPCYLGGIQLMYEQEGHISQSLPVPPDWYWVSAYSGISVSTAEARNILPKEYPIKTAISFAKKMGIFVDSLHRKDWNSAAKVLTDDIAEPYRKSLLPAFDDVMRDVKAAGALASGISGSGPTIFAAAPSLAVANDIAGIMRDNYLQNENGFCHVCRIDEQGTRVID